MHREFPADFHWGASTAAHQVEGGVENDWTRWERENAARLASDAAASFGDVPVWDQIRETATDPRNYVSGAAVEHYDRYETDFDLAAELGHTAHRFSVEWSRVEPERGAYDRAELDHYRDVVRALRERGMEPFVTLWHFTNPQWFADDGGWASGGREAFVDYVREVVRALRDDVTYWITVNEPEVYASAAYLYGDWPPGRQNPVAYFRVRKHLLEAHRAAAEVIREEAPEAQVGLATNVTNFEPKGGLLDHAIARAATFVQTDLDLRRAVESADFLGVNYYFHQPVRTGFEGSDAPRSDLGWPLHPDGLYGALTHVARYDLPVYVTEHGVADHRDAVRDWYLRRSLAAVHRAIEDGVDVRGYLHWSLLDNFEWDKGFWPEFGLLDVDLETMDRTILPSAYTYRDVVEQNGLASEPADAPSLDDVPATAERGVVAADGGEPDQDGE